MKLATTQDLIDRQNAIRGELTRLDEDPNTTEEDHADLRDTLIAEYETLDKRLAPIVERMEKLKLIQRASDDPANLESGDGGSARRWDGGPEFMQRKNPFADLDRIKQRMVPSSEMVARSMNVIETHDKRGLLPGDRGEEATRKAQNPMIARHMLLTGHDEYLDAFRTYLNDPTGEGQAVRTSLLTSQATAGFLLPYVLDTSIVLTNSGSTNPYRRIARVVQTTSNAWQGVNSAGVGVAMLNEGAAATDTGSAVAQIQIIPQKAAAWVTGSFEVMGDTDYASQLPTMFDDAKYILEEQKFALGTGGSTGPNVGEPLGILSAMGTAQRVAAAGGTGSGAFFAGTASPPPPGVQDVYGLNAALGPRFRLSPNVGWVMNITTINKIRALDVYGGGSFWANLGAGQPERLLDKPVSESPSLNSAGTGTVGTATSAGVAVFGDWSKFIIVDRIGSTMLFDPLLKAAGTANIPTGNQGWFYYWRFGSGVATSNAFRWIANA